MNNGVALDDRDLDPPFGGVVVVVLSAAPPPWSVRWRQKAKSYYSNEKREIFSSLNAIHRSGSPAGTLNNDKNAQRTTVGSLSVYSITIRMHGVAGSCEAFFDVSHASLKRK